MARRTLIAIGCLAFALHGVGIARCLLPAQDGLKFIRIARRFQAEPWPNVVRGSDQHPLYAALIAVAEPAVAVAIGEGPTAWRVAAQLVSVVAALATLVPLFGLSRALFGEWAAALATLLYILLPIPAALGRDTLSDALALFFFMTTLRLGEVALRTGRRDAWTATGLVAGVGYLARPEVLLVPVAVAATACLPMIGRGVEFLRRKTPRTALPGWPAAGLGSMAIAALTLVGGYAMVKGEVSEKLAVRIGGGLAASARPAPIRPAMAPGLDDPRWDFAPKEESSEIRIKGSPQRAALRLVQQYAEGFAWVVLPLLVVGLARAGTLEGSAVGRRLIGVYLVVFGAVVVRHAVTFGYLSGRHALTLVAATVPWAGAGLWAWARGLPARRGVGQVAARRLAVGGLAALIVLGASAQIKAMHPSRWGHREAGRWLAANAGADAPILDTRGWAAFVRGGPSYDMWHVRQALDDPALAFVVVGTDELNAKTRRAETLRSLLAYAGSPVAEFPERRGDSAVGVRVYRYRKPASWKGMTR